MSKLSRIHVNRNIIDANRKYGTSQPALTVKSGKTNTYGNTVNILGPSTLVYRPDKPLSCGAKAWIETTSPVEVLK